jgi:16S rRNA C1402 (ribose-2'-O) methylase RsmI
MGKDYNEINRQIKELVAQGIVNPSIGEAKAPVPAKIESANDHALYHGVTREEAQEFIDNAVVMFVQSGRSLYVSESGNAVLLDSGNRLISAYRRAQFDPGAKAILEVLKNV